MGPRGVVVSFAVMMILKYTIIIAVIIISIHKCIYLQAQGQRIGLYESPKSSNL